MVASEYFNIQLLHYCHSPGPSRSTVKIFRSSEIAAANIVHLASEGALSVLPRACKGTATSDKVSQEHEVSSERRRLLCSEHALRAAPIVFSGVRLPRRKLRRPSRDCPATSRLPLAAWRRDVPWAPARRS